AGVGKVKGFDVVVAGAARLVGKKVKARVGAVLEGVALAELVDGQEAERPITAEAEAEKPTRARKGAAEKAEEPAKEAAPRRRRAAAAEEPERPAAEAGEEAEAGEPAEAAVPRKRTRRGTRGGRGRKKKTAAASSPAAEAVREEPERPAPVIHLPDRDLGAEPSANGDEPAPKRRPTRRGSRGGRGRRKKTAAAAAPEAVAAEAREEPPAGGAGDWEYTPMSRWDEVEP